MTNQSFPAEDERMTDAKIHNKCWLRNNLGFFVIDSSKMIWSKCFEGTSSVKAKSWSMTKMDQVKLAEILQS